jgi:hypothetical protein
MLSAGRAVEMKKKKPTAGQGMIESARQALAFAGGKFPARSLLPLARVAWASIQSPRHSPKSGHRDQGLRGTFYRALRSGRAYPSHL